MSKNAISNDKTLQPCIILCTTNNQGNAVKIAQMLLNRHLAACISLLPELNSIYRWKSDITQDKEILLLIKSIHKNKIEVFKAIKEIHPYETPELISLDLEHVDGGYLDWLIKSMK
ncbi:periplasmic divalent cation tolerance protein [Providencia alcalifaciens]|nr:periplasmic divalent cation tolerance protein [Providencia alcalifaciens]